MPWTSVASHGLATTLFLSVCGWAGFGIVLAWFSVKAPHLQSRVLAFTIRMKVLVAALFGGIYLAALILTVHFPGYVDPCEPLVIAASYFVTHGVPVYHTVVAYGPYCFLPYSLAMYLFGNSLNTLRSTLIAGNVVLAILLVIVFRGRLTARTTASVVALLFASFLLNQNYSLQIRGDLFIYLAVTLGLMSLTLETPVIAILLMAIALSVATGVKFTGALYLGYPLVLFWRRRGTLAAVSVAAIAAIFSFAPFAMATLSLRDYVQRLQQMTHEPRSPKEFLGNLIVSGLLMVPVVLIWSEYSSRDRHAALAYLRSQASPLVVLLFSIVATAFLSAKFGAGRHHLTPFAIVSAYLAVDMYVAMQSWSGNKTPARPLLYYGWGCLIILLLISEVIELRRLWSLTMGERTQAFTLTKDVAEIVSKHPHTKIELGYGVGTFDLDNHYSEVYAAPDLIFRGNPYVVDLSAEADRELMSLPLTEDVFTTFADCKATVWLIPRGQLPFATRSIYSGMYPSSYPNHYLFPERLKQEFARVYTKNGSSLLFDLYGCRNPTPQR